VKTCEVCGERATIVRIGLATVDRDRNITGCDRHWLCAGCWQKTASASSPEADASGAMHTAPLDGED
jgi:hypothetical protein